MEMNHPVRKLGWVCAAAVMLCAPLPAKTVLMFDDFSGATPGGSYSGVISGTTSFKVISGDIDLLGNIGGSFFSCGSGGPASNNCLDLNGRVDGAIQTKAGFALVGGLPYTVTFDVAGPTGSIHPFYATLGLSQHFDFIALNGANFTSLSFTYTPASNEPAALLTFVSTQTQTPLFNGAILDNIELSTSAPEPGGAILPGSALLAMAASLRPRRR